MLYQTQTARKLPSAFTAVTRHPPAATEWCRLLLIAAYGVRRTPYHALSMGTTQQYFVFVPGDFDLWSLTLTFTLVWAKDQTRLPSVSCLWIWRKSVQRFPRYLSHNQKTNKMEKVTDSAKNRTLFACGNNIAVFRLPQHPQLQMKGNKGQQLLKPSLEVAPTTLVAL